MMDGRLLICMYLRSDVVILLSCVCTRTYRGRRKGSAVLGDCAEPERRARDESHGGHRDKVEGGEDGVFQVVADQTKVVVPAPHHRIDRANRIRWGGWMCGGGCEGWG